MIDRCAARLFPANSAKIIRVLRDAFVQQIAGYRWKDTLSLYQRRLLNDQTNYASITRTLKNNGQ